MSVERQVVIPGHVDAEVLSEVISSAIDGRDVEVTMRNGKCKGVAQFFDINFRDKNIRRTRLVRCHHGHNEGTRFKGQDYTSLVTGAFGVTDKVLKKVAETYGGNYLDEKTNEEIAYPDVPPAPTL
jgi:hypothetical protein